jgi:RNA polymerase sigma factor (sigma-70 family)
VTEPDSELIVRVAIDDDRPAFAELVRRHQSAVRRFLRHLSRPDDALADDLAQETFVRAYRNISRFRGDSAFSTWLLGIAHNQWRNARRRLSVDRPAPDASPMEDPSPSPADAAALRQDLAAALSRLSAEEQTALHLCYRQGLTHAEIAKILDWPLGTVKTHIARSKEKLRPFLAAWNPRT